MTESKIEYAYLSLLQRTRLLEQWQKNFPKFEGIDKEAIYGHVSLVLVAWNEINEHMKVGGEAPSAWKGSGRTFAPMEERTDAAPKRKTVK